VTEREKMIAGEGYDALDPELVAGRRRARELTAQINSELDEVDRLDLLRELFASFGEGAFVEPPIYCDYGDLTSIGPEAFLNFGCVILDCAPVSIGARSQLGPGVQLLAADHPRSIEERARKVELAKPISLGDDVWLGGGAIVCPGVSVGDGTIVGAGSVVTRDLPPAVVAAGNPCRVVRELRGGHGAPPNPD
jgi:maltose O-acetyltransferase